MAAETKYSANTGCVTISTGNTSLTTGTLGTNIYTVLSGGSNGTLIKTVTAKAQGTPGHGMIRLWINNQGTFTLLKEIEVVPVEQAGTDVSFEKTVSLDYILSSGVSLLASTQNSDTFNIIAEGLNISYYTTFIRPESTRYVATTGIAAISTGTSSMTGSGSTLLLTATSGKEGTVIESITMKATAATSADGMIRLFIYTGTTYYLFTEVFVPYSSQSGTYQSFEHTIVFPDTFQLQAGYSLYVSTQNSDSFHIVANAMTWGNPSGGAVNYTSASISSSTTETILHSYNLGTGLFNSGDLLGVYAQATVTNDANNKTFRIYINSANSLSGATLIGTYISASVAGDNIERLFPIISDTSLECYGGATASTRNEYSTTTGTSTAITVPSISGVNGTSVWLIISGQNASLADTTTIVWSALEKIF